MLKLEPYHVPLVTLFILPVAMFTPYLIGAKLAHIRWFFSYISDGGTRPPESCLFSFFFTLTAYGLCFTLWIRFNEVREFLWEKSNQHKCPKCLNMTGLILGCAFAFGISLVACFQENTVPEVHFFGAGLTFFCGGLYLVVQAYFTFKMLSRFASKTLAWFRLIGAILVLVLFFTSASTGFIAMKLYEGDDFTNFEPGKGGWEYHVVSVVTEWIMTAIVHLYFASFTHEFTKITRDMAKYRLVEVKQTQSEAETNKNPDHGDTNNTTAAASVVIIGGVDDEGRIVPE